MKMQVWNDDNKDYVEVLDGETIVVPARSFIELPLGKGKKLLRSFVPPRIDGMKNVLNPKKLRGEYPEGRYKVRAREEENKSQLTGEVFATMKELKEHLMKNEDKLVPDAKAKK